VQLEGEGREGRAHGFFQPAFQGTAGAGIGQSTGTQRLIKRLLKKIPLHLSVNITGPFRALIATAKSMQDPRNVIGDVLPRPLGDVPGITTEVRKLDDEQQQTQTPVPEQVNVAPPPATPTTRK